MDVQQPHYERVTAASKARRVLVMSVAASAIWRGASGVWDTDDKYPNLARVTSLHHPLKFFCWRLMRDLWAMTGQDALHSVPEGI